MNKYFTKEYIKKCDCEEIQGLRRKLQFGDIILWRLPGLEVFGWWTGKRNAYFPLKDGGADFEGSKENKMLWVPTGDQLDEEIAEICKKKHYTYFRVNALCDDYKFRGEIINPNEFSDTPKHDLSEEINSNPLIAKIRLLKELSKESEGS